MTGQNRFPMPFLKSSNQAARLTARAASTAHEFS